MSVEAWSTMIAVLVFVWGGFVIALVVAVRKEAEKRGPEGIPDPGSRDARG